MSILGSIISSIFGTAAGDPSKPASAAAASAVRFTSSSAPAAGGARTQSGTMAPVDVSRVLDDLAAKSKEQLEWRKSIVDLMKLLDLDSSLSARKALAKELGYTGSQSDSAAMNVWLHKQVMTKLADNGGIVPQDLKH